MGEHTEVTQAGGQETFQDEAFEQRLGSERSKGGVGPTAGWKAGLRPVGARQPSR